MNAKYKLTNQKLNKLDIFTIAVYLLSLLEIYPFPNRIWKFEENVYIFYFVIPSKPSDSSLFKI